MEEEKLEHRNASAAVIGAGDFIGSAIARKFAGEVFPYSRVAAMARSLPRWSLT
jgi:predicted amino acid dehydrogenase